MYIARRQSKNCTEGTNTPLGIYVSVETNIWQQGERNGASERPFEIHNYGTVVRSPVDFVTNLTCHNVWEESLAHND